MQNSKSDYPLLKAFMNIYNQLLSLLTSEAILLFSGEALYIF